MIVMTAAAPAFTSLHSSSPIEYEKRLVLLLRVLTWGAVFVALATTLFSKPIVALLYGESYLEASGILALHAWAGVFVSFGLAASPWLTNRGELKFNLYQTLAGAIANIAANLFLIPRYGATGAALATVLSQSISGLLFNAVFARTRPLFRLQIRSLIGI
jgi:PST family polysaccharide transporter